MREAFKQTFTNRYGKGARTPDDKRKAKPPGKRISKKGKTYYESRKNRSDTEEELSRYRRYRTVKHKMEVFKESKREKAKVKAAHRRVLKAVEDRRKQVNKTKKEKAKKKSR